MKTKQTAPRLTRFTAAGLVAAFTSASALAAESGTTASAQTPSPRKELPIPDPEFKGKIGETLKDSTPSYPQPLKAPQGSPNVLVILLDDVGFGHTSTFGGPVPTPTLSPEQFHPRCTNLPPTRRMSH